MLVERDLVRPAATRRPGPFRAAPSNPGRRIRLSARLFAQQPWLVGAEALCGTCDRPGEAFPRVGGAARG